MNNGEINTRLQTKGGVDKHNPRTREYREYSAIRQRSGLPPPSYFTDDPQKLHKEVLEKIVSSDARTVCFGTPLRIIQYISFDRPIGYTYNRDGTQTQTSLVAVVHSDKQGMHYYPDSEGKGGESK